MITPIPASWTDGQAHSPTESACSEELTRVKSECHADSDASTVPALEGGAELFDTQVRAIMEGRPDLEATSEHGPEADMQISAHVPEAAKECSLDDAVANFVGKFTDTGISIDEMEKELNKNLKAVTTIPTSPESSTSKLQAELEDALKKGNVKGRTPVGQRFGRYLRANVAKMAEYKLLVGTQAQMSFKVNWAEAELALVQETQTHSKSLTVTGSTSASMFSFGRIVQEEGGWEDRSAIKAALTYCKKCALMGTPWVQFNNMTERYDFNYVSTAKRTDFAQSWETKKSTTSSNDEVANVAEASVEAAETPIKASSTRSTSSSSIGVPKLKAKGKAKPSSSTSTSTPTIDVEGAEKTPLKPIKRKDGKESDEPCSAKRIRKEADSILVSFDKARIAYQSSLNSCSEMILAIDEDPSWEWANGSKRASLEKAMTEAAASKGQLVQEMMLHDVGFIKGKYAAQDIINRSSMEMPTLQLHITAMRKILQKLRNMQQQNTSP
jgi:hypothetical protein